MKQQGIVVLDGAGLPVSPSFDREAWMPVRAPRIGSSDVAAIFGKDQYQGPWDVWDRMVLGDWDLGDSADTRRGRRQERCALEKFTEETGLAVESLPMVHHPKHPLLVSDLDGTITAPDVWPDVIASDPLWDAIRELGGDGAAEAKVPRTASFYNIRDMGVGPDRVIQMQHHLTVTGLGWGVFIVFNPEYDDLVLIPVLRDAEWCAFSQARLLAWHETHVVGRVRPVRPEPEPARWPSSIPGRATVLDDPVLGEWADLLALRHYELADATAQYEETEREFVKHLPDKGAHLAINGVVVKRRSSASQRRKDNGAVRAALKLLQEERDAEALLAFDPDDAGFYYQTKTSEKIDIVVTSPNPQEIMA